LEEGKFNFHKILKKGEKKKVDYIKHLEAFYTQINYNPISSNAMTMYQALLFIAYQAKRIDELSVANNRLQMMCGLTEKEFRNSRNELINKNYIKYKKGRNQNSAPKYYIPSVYENSIQEKGRPPGRAVGIATGIAEGSPTGNIMTRLDLLFNYLNNSSQDFFEDEKRTINLQDKALLILHLKRLGLFVEDKKIIELFTESTLLMTKIYYWTIKELYFSAFKQYLNKLTYNRITEKYLKAWQYTDADTNFDAKRLIGYLIKSIQEMFKEEEAKNGNHK